MRGASAQPMMPLAASQKLPLLAVNSVDAAAPMAPNSHRSRRRSSATCSPSRCSAVAASAGPSVLPNAIKVATQSGLPDAKATSKAPTNTPGQTPTPKRNNAANAMPSGGQIRPTPPSTCGAARPTSPPKQVSAMTSATRSAHCGALKRPSKASG